jgi:lysophospholipase L1-like esterase
MPHMPRLLGSLILIALIATVGLGVTPSSESQRPQRAQSARPQQKWVASWATSMHGPYPSGNPSAQPVLDFAIESAAQGAVDQTMRLIIKPDLWGREIRLHFANTFGTRAVTFDDVFVGLHGGAASVVAGTNQPVTFAAGADRAAEAAGAAGAAGATGATSAAGAASKSKRLTLAPGAAAWSEPVTLPWVSRASDPLLAGRKLAVSFHIVGESGPMTWHAKALTTSYLSPPRSGSHGEDVDDARFPYTTTSWFFLDGLDVMAASDTTVVACFGDSITDGTLSTLNGDDRWPDVLSRRLHAVHGDRVSVVNAGIGGNRITGPAAYSIDAPYGGGPSALDRLERDVLSLSGLSAIVWLEGINDLAQGASAEDVIAGMREVARRVQAHGGDEGGSRSANGIKLIAATLTSSVGSTTAHGTPDAEARRQAVNTFIRTSGIFAGVADFDAATRDDKTGGLRPAFVPNSTIGGPGDRLHPNRAGYLAMGQAVDLTLLRPAAAK